jgi:WASH complex subunit 7
MYPSERAEGLYKEIKKLGTFDDGKNFLDKFRILITEVGNALGFVRLLRSAQLNFCAKSIEYLPFGYERESSF